MLNEIDYGSVTEYFPSFKRYLPYKVDVPTAWNGLEEIIPAIIHDFGITPGIALEFGVDYGFSTAALANYFGQVVGVDTFLGDCHAGYRDNLMPQTMNALKEFKNISLIQSSFQEWIAADTQTYDLIHIDIVHTYQETLMAGIWAIQHSNSVLFHDTLSFPEVGRAVAHLARTSQRTFYNYPLCHGLGILRRGR